MPAPPPPPPSPPPALPLAGTTDAATQTEPELQAIGRPAWLQYAEPVTGRLWRWNNLTEEWFWADRPDEWHRYHCDVAGTTRYYWLRQGPDDDGRAWHGRPFHQTAFFE